MAGQQRPGGVLQAAHSAQPLSYRATRLAICVCRELSVLREDSATQQMELMRTLSALQARCAGVRWVVSHGTAGWAHVLLLLLVRLHTSSSGFLVLSPAGGPQARGGPAPSGGDAAQAAAMHVCAACPARNCVHACDGHHAAPYAWTCILCNDMHPMHGLPLMHGLAFVHGLQVHNLEQQLGITRDELAEKDAHLDLLRCAGFSCRSSTPGAGLGSGGSLGCRHGLCPSRLA